jgi:hypothetical protein
MQQIEACFPQQPALDRPIDAPRSGDRNPTLFIAREAEEMVGDAAARCRDLDLIRGHPNMLARTKVGAES